MATIPQIEANRRNAEHSSGPKTPEGKAASKRNALKHGLLANEAVLPQESLAEFEQLLSGFLDEHRPATATEDFLVRQMADAQWRLRRFSRIETGLIDALVGQFEANYLPTTCRNISDPEPTPEEKAIRVHDRGTGVLGCAFLRDPNALALLARYQTNLRRQFYRALEEFRRLRTHPIPQPTAPDPQPIQTNPIPPCPAPTPITPQPPSPLIPQPAAGAPQTTIRTSQPATSPQESSPIKGKQISAPTSAPKIRKVPEKSSTR